MWGMSKRQMVVMTQVEMPDCCGGLVCETQADSAHADLMADSNVNRTDLYKMKCTKM